VLYTPAVMHPPLDAAPSPTAEGEQPAPPRAPVRSPVDLDALRHAIRGATARLEALSHGVAAGVLFLGREGRVDLVNAALCRMLRLGSASEVVGKPEVTVARLLADRFADPVAFARRGFLEESDRLRLADGRVLSRELVPVGADRDAHGVLVLLRELPASPQPMVSEQEPLHTVSVLDELTGLFNRRGFLAQASRRLRRASQDARMASLFCLDVDGMKTINDRLGHAAGDRALQEAATLLRTGFREGDLVGRLGGDEFAVLTLDVGEAEQAEIFERLAHQIALLNARPARAWRLSLGVGAATFDASRGPLVEDLLSVADARLYTLKRARSGKAG
jgi:diguanylate cyclase (GGDEF)-like protein